MASVHNECIAILRQLSGEAFIVELNLLSIFDQLRTELAPATIIHNEHSAVLMNNFGDQMLVRRVSGDAICELPKREPGVVFNKNLKNLVENMIWIKHHVYSTPSFRRLVQKFRQR
jgi:hypothetical protein